MTVTLTPRFGQPQWSSGSDNPGRTSFNDAFAALDQKGALDPGAQDAQLPTTLLVDGRYAHVVSGTDRRLYRRGGGSWQQVGGNTWAETVYHKGVAGSPQTGVARQISHADLTNPTVVETWDGGSVRSGRQAFGEVNGGANPAALHVGDTASAVDLSVRGRIYARTTADGQRGIVASAHGAGAGNLFTAREPGGTEPWTVDSLGRMRSQGSAAFGAGVLTAGVPIASAPGANDASAADLYAAAGKPALRLYRAAGDAAAIGSFGQDQITLGRASWAGARIDLIAPNVGVTGAFGVAGALSATSAAVSGTLGVTGVTTLGTANVTNLAATTLNAGTLGVTGPATIAGSLIAQGGKIVSNSINTDADLRADYTVGGTVYSQSLRAPIISMGTVATDVQITTSTQNYDIPFTVMVDGWVKLDVDLWIIRNPPATGTTNRAYMVNAHFTASLRTAGGSTLFTALQRTSGVGDDYAGGFIDHFMSMTVIPNVRVTAGSYVLRVAHYKDSGSPLPIYLVNGQVVCEHVILASSTSS